MRNSKEISVDLDVKMKAYEAAADAERATLASEVENLTRELQDAQIDEAARRALANQRTLSPAEEKEVRQFSFTKFIREAAEGKLSGFEAEMNEEGCREAKSALGQTDRGFYVPSILLRGSYNNATDAGYGKEFVQVTRMDFAEAVHNAMVGGQLGVRYLNGLQGNLSVVKGGAATASWKAEEGAESAQRIGYGLATMTPKRVQAIAGYTWDLLKQTSLAADQLIYDELVASVAAAIDGAIFAGAGSNGEPAGILNTTGIGSVACGTDNEGGVITYDALVGLETEVAKANNLRGNLGYVTSAKVLGMMKTTPKISGYPAYLYEDGKANGYNVAVTNAMPDNLKKGTGAAHCSAAIFGNFQEVLVGAWGGLNVVVDPFTQKGKSVIEVSVASYNDILVRRPAAFAAIKDIYKA